MQQALGSIVSKNQAKERKIMLDMKNSEKQMVVTTVLTLNNQIREETKEKHKLENQLKANCGGDMKVAADKIRAVKLKLSAANTATNSSTPGSDDDDTDDYVFEMEPLSQEDIIRDLFECSKRLADLTKCSTVANNDMKQCFVADNKENETTESA